MGSFINPAMLWFGLAGAVPIIIHILNRQRYRRVPWAAMEFLLRALKKNKKRLLLEDLIILALRVALLVLLAGALAQPLWNRPALAALTSSDTYYVLVLDHSYSMGYERPGRRTPFEQAKALATQVLSQVEIAQGDKLSLVLLSDAPTALMAEPSIQTDLARKRIAELTLSDRGTSMERTVPLVADLVEKSTQVRKRVIFFTDLQRGAWNVEESERTALKDGLERISSTPGASVFIMDVGTGERRNLAIERLSSTSKVIGVDKPVTFAVQVRNFGDEEAGVAVTLFVDNARQETSQGFSVPGRNVAVTTFSVQFHEAGPHVVTAEIDADPLTPDNKRSLAVEAHASLKVLLANGEPSAETYQDEAIYLRLALNPFQDDLGRDSIFVVDTVSPVSFPETPIKKYDLVILANLEMVYEEKVAELEQYVKSGGGLMIWLGDKVSQSGYNELLWKGGEGLLPCELGEIAGDRSHQQLVRLDKPELGHAALSFFADLLARPLLPKLSAYEYYRMTADESRPEVKVLARFSDPAGSPALVERRFGRGKVILVATSADYEWTDMLKEPGYLILVDQLAQYLASQPQAYKNVLVGEPIEYFLRIEEYAKLFHLVTPHQGITSLAPAKVGERGFFLSYRNTEDSGAYVMERPSEENGKTELLTYFTVNVDPQEGDVARVSEEELRQRFPGFKFAIQSDQGRPGETVDIRPQAGRLWRFLAYAACAAAVAEMLLAAYFGRRK